MKTSGFHGCSASGIASLRSGRLFLHSLLAVPAACAAAAEPTSRPVDLLRGYCAECHAGTRLEGDVDLSSAGADPAMRADVTLWQRVAEMVATRQMPPKEAPQPADGERAEIAAWLRGFLAAEARASAGDPGRVVLRRLNNAEYTYTLRDLTGIESLDPAREFPADAGAGEGFTNTGQSLVMSPSLVTKYLDAGKAVADHAVLLPDGIRWSAGDSRRDFSDELVARIQAFYRRFTAPSGQGLTTVQQGITLDMGNDGFLRFEPAIAALVAARAGAAPPGAAPAPGVSPKYLAILREALLAGGAAGNSPLIDSLRGRIAAGGPGDVAGIVADVTAWQNALWKFNKAGQIGRHLGRPDGPPSWQEPTSPLAARHEVRQKLVVPAGAESVTVRLAVTGGGTPGDGDVAVWERPRLVAKGRPELAIAGLRGLVAAHDVWRERLAATAGSCLEAVAMAATTQPPAVADRGAAIAVLAARHLVDPRLLEGWLAALGVWQEPVAPGKTLTRRLEWVEHGGMTYAGVRGWAGAGPLQVIANATDETVRVPGTIRPHGVAVHPSVKERVVVSWQSPVQTRVKVTPRVEPAHLGCGNGVNWSLELRRGGLRVTLAAGVKGTAADARHGPLDVAAGDVIALVVAAKDGNESCDLTAVDLSIDAGDRSWDLARDVSADILAGNPHGDAHGNAGVWKFSGEPEGQSAATLAAGSLLARFATAASGEGRRGLAADVRSLLLAPDDTAAADSPDRESRRLLLALDSPVLARVLHEEAAGGAAKAAAGTVGADPAKFGSGSGGPPVGPDDLRLRSGEEIAVTIPAALAADAELVSVVTLHPAAGPDAFVQPSIRPEGAPAHAPGLSAGLPVVARPETAAWARLEQGFADFRRLFPRALCYARVVPVDEVVTLNVYYREDEELRRLVLDDAQAAEIDRLWDELFFVSQEPLAFKDAYEQLLGYASQDRADLLGPLNAMRPAIEARAAAFRERFAAAEPRHVDAVVAFAGRAFRRPLTQAEEGEIRRLYARLRQEEIPHDEAIRLSLARILVAPAFLYKLETPGPGTAATPVSGVELASRLSYFLWSSPPDAELLEAGESGRLADPDVLVAQTRRMLRDPRIRRLAAEFGTQWLHVHGFAAHDEKSPEAFPTFAAVRGGMEEETILFVADCFASDLPVTALFDADHTFVDETLARHYRIPDVSGTAWRRVDGVRKHGRGGILGLAAVLATQSGASRTSPILRGNWLSETILGERLPKPPKDVPVLAETPPAGLTERQLVALHSSADACATCHRRIDPLGFALEAYDGIGRLRTADAAGQPIDTRTRLEDGTEIDGPAGLRAWLLGPRKDAVLRQFCRKLLGYALGRGVQLSDEPLLDDLQARLTEGEGRISAVVEGIVTSRQFREIRGRDTADEP
jgi:hypothetical protein